MCRPSGTQRRRTAALPVVPVAHDREALEQVLTCLYCATLLEQTDHPADILALGVAPRARIADRSEPRRRPAALNALGAGLDELRSDGAIGIRAAPRWCRPARSPCRGFASITSIEPLHHLGASSPLTPRLSTVMPRPLGNCGAAEPPAGSDKLSRVTSRRRLASKTNQTRRSRPVCWPQAMAAACGSEPIDRETPFGAEQGTRLKMRGRGSPSPAPCRSPFRRDPASARRVRDAPLDEDGADRTVPPIGSAKALLPGTVCAATVEVNAPANVIASAARQSLWRNGS